MDRRIWLDLVYSSPRWNGFGGYRHEPGEIKRKESGR